MPLLRRFLTLIGQTYISTFMLAGITFVFILFKAELTVILFMVIYQ